MSKPARRKDIDRLRVKLDDTLSQDVTTRSDLGRMMDTLADHGIVLSRLERDLNAKRTLSTDIERIATLLDGVRVALERMGGNTLPSMMTDVHALRDQMAEFRREMAGYRSMLMMLSNWLDTVAKPPEPPVRPEPTKRRYNRKKSKPEVEISAQDAAPHNERDQEFADPLSSKLEH